MLEVFERFRDFKTLIENQIGRNICVLRMDNGGEYTSNESLEYCSEEGTAVRVSCGIGGWHTYTMEH